jgi:ATP-binding cassette subfamily B multidrug efflux pump
MAQMMDNPADQLAEKGLDWRLTKRLLFRARGQWGQLALAAGLLLLITVGEQIKPYLLKILMDDYALKGDFVNAIPVLGLFAMSMVWVFGLQFWQTMQTKRMGQDLMLDLRCSLFAKIHAQPLRYFDKNPVGSLMTRVIYDVETLNQFFTAGVSAVFQDLFTLIVIAFLMLKMDWRLGLAGLAVVPFLLWSTKLFRKRARENFRAVRTNSAALNAFLTENLSGMPTVQLFNREARNEEKFDAVNKRSLDILLEQIRINAFFLPLAEVLSALTITLIFWYGGVRHMHSGLTVGAIWASVMYVQRLYEPLRDLTEKFNIFQSAMASSERIFALLDRQEEVQDLAQPLPDFRPEGAIEFENLWFAYEEDRWVLKNLSFKAPAGSRIAIVGPTGAGKTSLINVLFRFYPWQKGRVLLDGRPLDQLRRSDFRRHFALVPQDPFLFSGSVLENLRLSDPEIPRQRVEWAAKQVRAHDFISELPGGYDGLLNEGGSNLSTGQKQLLSFARALVFDPAVLVLDEATASVDTQTEAEIQGALDVLLKGRTSITIAHRLSTVRNADKILVLRDGELAEQGTHAELLAAQGLYRGLVELQFKET